MSSFVWNFFTKSKDNNIATCNICESRLAYKDGSTSSLKRHCERKHEDSVKRFKDQQGKSDKSVKNVGNLNKDIQHNTSTQGPSQPSLHFFYKSSSKLDNSSTTAKKITTKIVKMMTVDLQPLSIVTDEGFRDTLKAAEPRYVIPTRSTFRYKHLPAL